MGFSARNLGRLWLAVLLWVGVAVAAADNRITVFVNNSAGTPATVLLPAEAEAARVLSAAGIDVGWVNCPGESSPGDGCRRSPGANEFMLHIVPYGKTTSDSVFGEAFLGEDGSGKYCDVFLNRIEGAYRDAGTNEAQMLGAVAAHELGHLLLGSHSHSHVGIMEPIWQQRILRQIGMGTLLFTPEQSMRMRRRVGAEMFRVSLPVPTRRDSY